MEFVEPLNSYDKRQKRHLISLKKWLWIILLIVFIALMIGRYAWQVPSFKLKKLIIASKIKTMPIAWPATGQAAIGELGQGVLATSAIQTAKPTASVAKTMLALCVLKKDPLSANQTGPLITISPSDVAIYNHYLSVNGSVVKVLAGEQINEYQALEAIMLPSANNMADTVAIWAFGSLSNYWKIANQTAAQLGMTQSTFGGDASGFLPVTTSTPHDLVLLGQAALQNSELSHIVSQQSADLPVAGIVRNYNWLLGSDGVIGIKTGNSEQAGGVSLVAAKRILNGHTVTLISAVTDQPNLSVAMAASLPILSSTFADFGNVNVIHAGQTVAYLSAPWQNTIPLVAQHSIDVFGWLDKSETATINLRSFTAAKANSVVGTISLGALSSPVIAQHNLRQPNWWWRLVR